MKEGQAINSDKIILNLCGGTGAWSRPYHEAGYDVRLITLPENNVLTYEPPDGVYGILAAPPCTEFSQALNGRRQRDIPGALQIVNACIRIMQHCTVYGNLKFWALENPAALLSPTSLAKYIGRPHYSFEQWQFGGDKGKLTYIFGWCTEPKSTIPVKLDFGKGCHAHAPGWTKPATRNGAPIISINLRAMHGARHFGQLLRGDLHKRFSRQINKTGGTSPLNKNLSLAMLKTTAQLFTPPNSNCECCGEPLAADGKVILDFTLVIIGGEEHKVCRACGKTIEWFCKNVGKEKP